MQQTDSAFKAHTLTLKERCDLSLSGVEDVLSFDEASIACRTTLGDLIIEGSSLRISDFSAEKGTLSVCGTVSGLYYEEKREKGKRGRLFGLSRA